MSIDTLLEEYTSTGDSMILAELVFTLRIIPPGGTIEEREIWGCHGGVFEGKTVEELVYGSTQKRSAKHITPQGWEYNN